MKWFQHTLHVLVEVAVLRKLCLEHVSCPPVDLEAGEVALRLVFLAELSPVFFVKLLGIFFGNKSSLEARPDVGHALSGLVLHFLEPAAPALLSQVARDLLGAFRWCESPRIWNVYLIGEEPFGLLLHLGHGLLV